MGSYVSNLIHGVLNGVELELVYFVISYSIIKISWAKVHYANVGLQLDMKITFSERKFKDLSENVYFYPPLMYSR